MKKILLVLITSCVSLAAMAQIEAPVKWSYAAKRVSSNEAIVFLKATINDGWHIYGMDVKDGGPIKTSFTFPPSKAYSLVGKTSQPVPVTKYEKAFSMNVTYFEKSVVFQQKIHLKTPGAQVIKGQLEYMTCNDKKCLPPEDVDFSVPIAK
jgi:DsbC/DsbD-like thiol-disulfide interchange protein